MEPPAHGFGTSTISIAIDPARAAADAVLDGIWIEKPKRWASVLLELAGEQRIAAQEINTEWVE